MNINIYIQLYRYTKYSFLYKRIKYIFYVKYCIKKKTIGLYFYRITRGVYNFWEADKMKRMIRV